eukprot:scaffold5707_cov36-Phaeocystis_antarctica.AAC.1
MPPPSPPPRCGDAAALPPLPRPAARASRDRRLGELGELRELGELGEPQPLGLLPGRLARRGGEARRL